MGINKNTVVDWNKFAREVNTADLLANPVVIGGSNTTVEVDESLFTQKKLSGVPVTTIRGNCRETSECFVYTVPDSGIATLVPIKQRSFRPGTTIMPGLWVIYGAIQATGYTDLTINHKYEFVDPIPRAYTQNMENLRQNAKLRSKKQYGTHRTTLDDNLSEKMWRQQHRINDKFDQIIADIVAQFWPM